MIVSELFLPSYAGWLLQTNKIIDQFKSSHHVEWVTKGDLQEVDGIHVVSIKYPSRARWFLAFIVRLFVFKPDIVFLPYSFFPIHIALFLRFWPGISCIARISGSELKGGSGIGKWLRLQSIYACDVIIVLNAASKKSLPLNIQRKAQLLRNSVDTALFYPAEPEEKQVLRHELGLPVDKKILISIGIVCPRKRTIELIEVLSDVFKKRSDLHLILVGPWEGTKENEPEYSKKCLNTFNASGLSKQCMLVPFTNKVASYLRASDIFVSASASEGSPNALLEAAACGLPSLTSRIDAYTELVVENNFGFCEEMTDSGSWVARTNELFNSNDVYETFSKNASTFVSKYASEIKRRQQYEEIFGS